MVKQGANSILLLEGVLLAAILEHSSLVLVLVVVHRVHEDSGVHLRR